MALGFDALSQTPLAALPTAAAAAAAAASYAPEVRTGPPLRGAPWRAARPFVLEGGLLLGPPAPLTPSPLAYAPEVRTGPPLRGAPWRAARPFVLEGGLLPGKAVLPGTPGGPKVPLSALPLLSRVPGETDARRLARFTEKLSSLWNSLVGSGQLIQTGPASYQIVVAGTTTGLSGAFS